MRATRTSLKPSVLQIYGTVHKESSGKSALLLVISLQLSSQTVLAKSFILEKKKKTLYFSATVRGPYPAIFGNKRHQNVAAIFLKP